MIVDGLFLFLPQGYVKNIGTWRSLVIGLDKTKACALRATRILLFPRVSPKSSFPLEFKSVLRACR